MIADDSIPPHFLHLFNLHKQNNNCNIAALFLKHQGRRIESALGDGNCLVWALSFLLCGNQGMHIKAGGKIAHCIKQNKRKFQPYLIQGTIDAHIMGYTGRDNSCSNTLPNTNLCY